MTSLELYNNYLRKINKNDTNRNIKIPKGQFVNLYNEQTPIWLKAKIKNDIQTDRINDIGELLELDKELIKYQDNLNTSDFIQPSDYFEYSSSYCIAKKGNCDERVLYCWNNKNKNKNTLLINDNQKPSFEFEDTFVAQNKNVLSVYKTDFEVKRFYLDYYKLPKKIDIDGYINVDGTPSTTINPEISEYLANQILNYCVLETIRVYESPEAFQLAKERIEKEI